MEHLCNVSNTIPTTVVMHGAKIYGPLAIYYVWLYFELPKGQMEAHDQ